MKTVPNQNIIVIKKTPCKDNFLKIKNNEWMQAAKTCGDKGAAFKLYLYLAANEIGFNLALSKVAVENAIGVKQSNYYKCFDFLVEQGYLRQVGKNKYEFYTSPYIEDKDSTVVENYTPVEKVEKNPLSTPVENSTQVEKVNTFNF